MKILTTRVHGMIDYTIGVILIAAPWLLDFARGGAETWVPVILGIGIITYSLMTNYELGVVKSIPMTTHLWLDGIAGAFLALSPWLLNFADFVYIPHVIVGLLEIGVVFITQTVPSEVDIFKHRAKPKPGL